MIRRKAIALFALTFAILGVASSGHGISAEQPPGGAQNHSVDFVNQVMPLLNKLGCNQTKCHGSLKGKSGFKLSMFGTDLANDYAALTKSAEGRRVNKVEPDKSLFLLKATASISHEGAKAVQVQPGSSQYNTLASWVAQGAPWGDEQAPKLVSVKAAPQEQVLQKGGSQQISVTATFSDGSQKDVTQLALYASSQSPIAAVDAAGKVQAGDFGESHILVTYMRQADVVRILVPQPLPSGFPKVEPNNKIDEFVFAKLQKLGIPPSELCSDQEFIRRLYLDLIGTLPSPGEVRAFVADADPQKRSKLVEGLLEREEFADFWALKWGDLLKIKSEYPHNLWPKAAEAYYRWLRESIARNKPYDQFARELLTASGSNFRYGAVNYYRAVPKKDGQTFADTTALIFMGARVGCGRCHGHPVENWGLDEMLGLGAFFAQVQFKATKEWKEEIVYLNPKQVLRHPKTGEVIKPQVLGGEPFELGPKEDPREKFSQWLTSPENPWFAKNIVNRIWFWLLGRGIIHEPDDLRPTNLPENPELLAYLEKELVGHNYDLRHIYRLIANSKTYQLSSVPNEWNRWDVAHFSHYGVRRLGAEQLLDAVSRVTETTDRFSSIVPAPTVTLPADFRAIQLSDANLTHPFLDLFGRPSRDTPFESERNDEVSMRQALYFVNANELQSKVANSPRLKRLIQEGKGDPETIDELYLAALSRPPTEAERIITLDHVLGSSKPALEQAEGEKKAADEALAKVKAELEKAKAEYEAARKAAQEAETAAAKARLDKLAGEEKAATSQVAEANKKVDAAKALQKQLREPALQDVLWALLNTKEFMFNH